MRAKAWSSTTSRQALVQGDESPRQAQCSRSPSLSFLLWRFSSRSLQRPPRRGSSRAVVGCSFGCQAAAIPQPRLHQLTPGSWPGVPCTRKLAMSGLLHLEDQGLPKSSMSRQAAAHNAHEDAPLPRQHAHNDALMMAMLASSMPLRCSHNAQRWSDAYH